MRLVCTIEAVYVTTLAVSRREDLCGEHLFMFVNGRNNGAYVFFKATTLQWGRFKDSPRQVRDANDTMNDQP